MADEAQQKAEAAAAAETAAAEEKKRQADARQNAIVKDHVARQLKVIEDGFNTKLDALMAKLDEKPAPNEDGEVPAAVAQIRAEAEAAAAAFQKQIAAQEVAAKAKEEEHKQTIQLGSLRSLLMEAGVSGSMLEAAHLLAQRHLSATGGISTNSSGELVGHVQHADWKEPLALAAWVKKWEALQDFQPAKPKSTAPTHGRKTPTYSPALPADFQTLSPKAKRAVRIRHHEVALAGAIAGAQRKPT